MACRGRRVLPFRNGIASLFVVASGLALPGCDGDTGSRSREVASNPVAPAGAPLPIGAIGPDGSEALEGALDPFSLPAGFHAASGPLTPSTTTLPVDETYGGGAGWAFKITQEGSGNAGWFRVTSPSSQNRMALLATHTGEGIAARAINTGNGRALWAQIPDVGNSFDALVGTHVGSGSAVFGLNVGTGPAGLFEVRNGSSGASGLVVRSDARGAAISVESEGTTGDPDAFQATAAGPSGNAGEFGITDPSNSQDALFVTTQGTGAAGFFQGQNATGEVLLADGGDGFNGLTDAVLRARHFGPTGLAAYLTSATGSGVLRIEQTGIEPSAPLRVRTGSSSGDFAIYEVVDDNRIRFDRTGKGFFDGGTQMGGADIAESFAVEGPRLRFEPGDVLVISTAADRTVERSTGPQSTRVIGVYATKPGVLLSDEDIEAPSWGRIPVGVMGVIPTKVTSENGPIARGDLLVTSSRPGHAMKARSVLVQGVEIHPHGAILGKALQPFAGPGTGSIEVMVNVK